MIPSILDPMAGILLIPIVAAAVLALLPSYRLSARLNVLASFLTFLAALCLFGSRPEPGKFLFSDDLNIVFIVLNTFVGFTTSVFSASYIGHELETGRLTPFGGQVRMDGELEFFVFAPEEEEVTREIAYRQVEEALVERARAGTIMAGVIILDVVVPDGIESPFRDAIGIALETPEFSRFFFATYSLTRPGTAGMKGSVDYGEIIPMDAPPVIFAGLVA